MTYALDKPARYLVQWDRYVQEANHDDYPSRTPRYREVLHHFAEPCASMAEARRIIDDLAWKQGETDGRGMWGHAIYRRPPFNVRTCRIVPHRDVDISRPIARATKACRKREAEDRAKREKRETREKRARLAALKRELGEE